MQSFDFVTTSFFKYIFGPIKSKKYINNKCLKTLFTTYVLFYHIVRENKYKIFVFLIIDEK